jgi:hypothetical protein
MSISKDLQKRSRKSSPNKSAISKNVPGKDATKQAGATATTSNFVLKREHIRLPVEGLSGLSKMFKSGGGGVETNGLRLLIYLPNRLPMNLQVSRSATVEQTIEKVLKLHKNANNSTNNVASSVIHGTDTNETTLLILKGSAACYELRLHEEDGMPEEDFPALERTRRVKHFGGDEEHEYCLCRVEGMNPDEEEQKDGKGSSNTLQQNGEVQLPSGKYLKISLPGNLHSTLKKSDPRYRTLRDLIPVLANKQSMPNLYHETVQFEVSDEDCASLNMMSNILDLGMLLTDLLVDKVVLTTKKYADTPTQTGPRDSSLGIRGRVNSDRRNQVSSSVLGRVADQETEQRRRSAASQRPSEAAFRFDELTAAIYQEWRIKKRNKWGRWQPRILGVDIKKMYNKKLGKGRERRGSTVGVTNPERLITNILEIEYVDGTSTNFRLKHAEGDSTQTLEYEAETPHDCVEIVSKLKYILKRNEE